MDIREQPGVDVVADFNLPLPFLDDSVEEVYSSHCFEHVSNVYRLLQEICRICVPDALVIIKVPHFGQEMAMCPGHVHVISEQMIQHFDEFPSQWWNGKKRLKLMKKQYVPTGHLAEAKRLFPKMSDEQIYRYIQNTCHEVVFRFRVRERPLRK